MFESHDATSYETAASLSVASDVVTDLFSGHTNAFTSDTGVVI